MKVLFFILFISSVLFAQDPKIDFISVKQYIDMRFSKAKIEMIPYPHMIIKDLLPDDLYEKVQYFWPDSEAFSHQIQPHRHLYVTKGCADYHPLTDDQRLFWKYFGEIVMGYVKENIKNIFIETLNWKFPELSAVELYDLKQSIRFFDSRQDSLMEHHYGYKFGAHIDQAYLFATALFYCPEDDSRQHMSTLLLTPNDGIYPTMGAYHVTGNVSVAKRIPYTKNTLLIMPVHPKQLHGSEVQNEPGYIRKMYGMFIHLAPHLTEFYYNHPPFNYTAQKILYEWEQRFVRFKPHET